MALLQPNLDWLHDAFRRKRSPARALDLISRVLPLDAVVTEVWLDEDLLYLSGDASTSSVVERLVSALKASGCVPSVSVLTADGDGFSTSFRLMAQLQLDSCMLPPATVRIEQLGSGPD